MMKGAVLEETVVVGSDGGGGGSGRFGRRRFGGENPSVNVEDDDQAAEQDRTDDGTLQAEKVDAADDGQAGEVGMSAVLDVTVDEHVDDVGRDEMSQEQQQRAQKIALQNPKLDHRRRGRPIRADERDGGEDGGERGGDEDDVGAEDGVCQPSVEAVEN